MKRVWGDCRAMWIQRRCDDVETSIPNETRCILNLGHNFPSLLIHSFGYFEPGKNRHNTQPHRSICDGPPRANSDWDLDVRSSEKRNIWSQTFFRNQKRNCEDQADQDWQIFRARIHRDWDIRPGLLLLTWKREEVSNKNWCKSSRCTICWSLRLSRQEWTWRWNLLGRLGQAERECARTYHDRHHPRNFGARFLHQGQHWIKTHFVPYKPKGTGRDHLMVSSKIFSV